VEQLIRLVIAGDRDTVTRYFGNWVIADFGNLGYDVSTNNVKNLWQIPRYNS
jgi:hypothetical protein